MRYKLALQLFRTYNDATPSQDWLNINFNMIPNSRLNKFSINKTNRLKVGMNVISNRFNYLNGLIDLKWLDMTYSTYKLHCKRLFLN